MNRETGRAGDQFVGNFRRQLAIDERVLAVFTPAVNQIEAKLNLFDHVWNIGRIVLQVAIHGDDDIVFGVINPGLHGSGLSVITTELHDNHMRIGRGQSRQFFQAAIC